MFCPTLGTDDEAKHHLTTGNFILKPRSIYDYGMVCGRALASYTILYESAVIKSLACFAYVKDSVANA